MRVAYADPPYIRQAKRHYGCEEIDHGELIEQLQKYEVWALSMSAAMYSLKEIVALAPDDSRLGVWVKPFAIFKKGVNPAYTWEPVLYVSKCKAGRGVPTVRDHVSCNIALRKGLVGAKPEGFCFWLFEVLGMEKDDELVDLFPGTGGVTEAWERWKST